MPLGKGMANHFSILALRIPWTVWKGKNIFYSGCILIFPATFLLKNIENVPLFTYNMIRVKSFLYVYLCVTYTSTYRIDSSRWNCCLKDMEYIFLFLLNEDFPLLEQFIYTYIYTYTHIYVYICLWFFLFSINKYFPFFYFQ